jgi:hypothetical protein
MRPVTVPGPQLSCRKALAVQVRAWGSTAPPTALLQQARRKASSAALAQQHVGPWPCPPRPRLNACIIGMGAAGKENPLRSSTTDSKHWVGCTPHVPTPCPAQRQGQVTADGLLATLHSQVALQPGHCWSRTRKLSQPGGAAGGRGAPHTTQVGPTLLQHILACHRLQSSTGPTAVWLA